MTLLKQKLLKDCTHSSIETKIEFWKVFFLAFQEMEYSQETIDPHCQRDQIILSGIV